MTDRTIVVVSAFRPDDGLRRNLVQLMDAYSVIVIDDGSGSEYDDVFERLAGRNTVVHRLDRNSGIARALNVGVRAALADAADYVLMLDQDSAVEPALVDELIAAHRRATTADYTPGFAVPEYFAGVRQVFREQADGTLTTRHAIQSGMLVPRVTFERVGLLREDLFIDLVDTEFELRCSCAGMDGVAAPGTAMQHRLGTAYRRPGILGRLPFIPDELTLSTPFRYYYRVRNRIVVNARFGLRRPGWIIRDSILELLHFANAASVARPRRALLAVYRQAIADGVRGRMGRIPDAAAKRAATVRWAASELVPLHEAG
ncbi:glycosyltransferase [Agromyces sp. NPDC056379]|uniref:glycosyltransferase n=1 Tax=unclassified Agromyces TaxID=2639701 RepID=UPI0035D54554